MTGAKEREHTERFAYQWAKLVLEGSVLFALAFAVGYIQFGEPFLEAAIGGMGGALHLYIIFVIVSVGIFVHAHLGSANKSEELPQYGYRDQWERENL